MRFCWGFRQMKVEAKSKSAQHQGCHPERAQRVEGPAVSMLYVPLTMLTLRADRRSFDCASRDEAARGFAQDDSIFGRQYFG